ncbi:MBL fold metallo-hydrolase [Candidatus Woesearchaeota archaeon]|nr:MBL fold metallo-hydrolase [Candidatus Woesearchaeota archaeon]
MNANLYYIKKCQLLIDTGDRKDRQEIMRFLAPLVNPKDIKSVVFTHLHYDHIGNWDLFENATFYAHEKEIKDWQEDSKLSILKEETANHFKPKKIEPLQDEICNLQVIHTPGHTGGCICLYDKENKILFSGDTIFDKKILGRTDLPFSQPQKQQESILKLVELDHKILAPGHDY